MIALYVVTPEDMRKIDQRAIDEYKIPGLILMENAALKVVDLIMSRYIASGTKHHVLVLAGGGNNGGDGLAVARHLFLLGVKVEVALLGEEDHITGDAGTNLSILKKLGVKCFKLSADCRNGIVMDLLSQASLVVDAIFGTGLDRPVQGVFKEAIDAINQSRVPVISVDIPSGVHGETGHILGTAVRAADTVTFGFPKQGHLLYPGRSCTGRLHVVPISLPIDSPEALALKSFTMDRYEAAALIKDRPVDGHKGTFGKAAVIAGSVGMTGAASLASMAVLKGGAGLAVLGIPASLNPVLENKVTEVMTFPLNDRGTGHLTTDCIDQIDTMLEGHSVLAIGPGLGKSSAIREILWNIFGKIDISIVVDADGLNNISEDMELLRIHSSPVVLTPHPGEMARLTGLPLDSIVTYPVKAARDLAVKYGVIVLLKGATTVIAAPDGRTYFNKTGNSGMGTGGSGDVLTGLIASFIAQGYEAYDAAVLGCFVHGVAGDRAAALKGEAGMVAGDILESVPFVLKALYKLKYQSHPNEGLWRD